MTLKPKLPNIDLYIKSQIFTTNLQDKVISYWRSKQYRLRRPLLRKHWKILHLTNHGFGEQDSNKLAFASRQNNKMNLRKGNRWLNGMPLADKLKELKDENHHALFLARMVKHREIIKTNQLMLAYSSKLNPLSNQELKTIDKELRESQNIIKEIKDKDIVKNSGCDPVRQEKESEHQDLLLFSINLVYELGILDLTIDNFQTKNLDKVEPKISEYKKKLESQNPEIPQKTSDQGIDLN